MHVAEEVHVTRRVIHALVFKQHGTEPHVQFVSLLHNEQLKHHKTSQLFL